MVPDHAHPSRGLTRGLAVRSLALRDVRSYERLDAELRAGLVLAVGPNGAGKTNLLEAVHVATQGFSPRTRADQQLTRFGAQGCRIAVQGERVGGAPFAVELTVRPGEGKRARLNGVALRTAEQLRAKLPTLVFTPDRLVVVKGSPAARRAYFDRALARLLPGRATLPVEYAAAVGQRNAALRRIAARASTAEALAPWTAQVAELGEALVAARVEALALLGPVFAAKAAALGLPGARLAYAGKAPTVETLEATLRRDLERGTTGLGPHLDDVAIVADAAPATGSSGDAAGLASRPGPGDAAGLASAPGSGGGPWPDAAPGWGRLPADRDLRSYGSQGEQRLAVLALLLAEADVLAERRGGPPLLLLDDVLSELDRTRREALVRLLPPGGQTLMTATAADALAVEPDQLLVVSPGRVREG